VRGAWQHGHRSRLLARATVRRRRRVGLAPTGKTPPYHGAHPLLPFVHNATAARPSKKTRVLVRQDQPASSCALTSPTSGRVRYRNMGD
jgi:hypothetical protein